MAVGGEVRYTRSGAEFRVITAAELTAGHDETTWWRTCGRCNITLQGGDAALAEHREKVCTKR